MRESDYQNYLKNMPSTEREILEVVKKVLGDKEWKDPTVGYFEAALEDALYAARKERKKKAYEAQKEKKKRQEERDKEYYPKLEEWVQENVKPGMFLKMAGTRDRVGLREVIEVGGDRIVCYKIELPFLPWKGVIDKTHQTPYRDQITNHHWSKVLGPVKILPHKEVSWEGNNPRNWKMKRFTYTSLRKVL